MGWLIAIGIIILLAILPLGLSIIYNEEGLAIWNVIGPIRYIDDPEKKENKVEEKNEEPVKTDKNGFSFKKLKKRIASPVGGTLGELMPFLRSDWSFIGDILRKIHIKRMVIRMVIAGSDPADLALDYGKAWALLGNIHAWLERFFVIKKKNLDVRCDFNADKTRIFVQLDLRISLARLIHLIVRSAVRAVENNKNNDKGGTGK